MRYIIVNPQGPWIQGDLPAASPAQAVKVLEQSLSAPTDNEFWLVFEAPRDLPSARAGFGVRHPAVVEMLASAPRAEIRNSSVPEQPELFDAPAP